MTKEPWSAIWEVDIYSFFNTIAFSRKWHEHEKEELEKWKKG